MEAKPRAERQRMGEDEEEQPERRAWEQRWGDKQGLHQTAEGG